MMQQPVAEPVAGGEGIPEPAADDDSGVQHPGELPKTEFAAKTEGSDLRSPAPRSLFALMQRGDGLDDHSAMVATTPSQEGSAARNEPDPADDEEVEEEADVPPQSTLISTMTTHAIDPGELEPSKYRLAASKARKQAWNATAAGTVAVLASALSLLPNFLTSLPATALGFVAIIWGYLALTGPARREITHGIRGLSLVGMLLGTLGIFLGPLLFAGIGRGLREATGQQATRQHLQKIGAGMQLHYAQHDAYPVGGTFARNEAGAIKGQHGWMTFLLPFVGEEVLFKQIDLAKPYDDPDNRNAMGNNVGVYFAAGGDRARIGEGYSVSHYAGLGGEIDEANKIRHIGIFERDAAVKREEISDGQSSTLIVGELAGGYPPWGDPENWRTIGRGLNRDPNGFGSYSGNGATFLLADGSVKFFNNKTDPKLLEKLSTRDGAE